MRVSSKLLLVILALMGRCHAGVAKPGACVREIFEGEVQAGEGFVKPMGGGLELMVEPLASGWIVRVLPVAKVRPPHDYAELATPPYQSVSALLVGTDWSFRAQDAVAWNPRRFQFAPDARSFQELLRLYGDYTKDAAPAAALEAQLAQAVGRMPQGVFTILDAHLVPGTANQAQTAMMVASHFSSTAHTIEQPQDGKSAALGRITWMRFRVALELPAGFAAAKSAAVERYPCR